MSTTPPPTADPQLMARALWADEVNSAETHAWVGSPNIRSLSNMVFYGVCGVGTVSSTSRLTARLVASLYDAALDLAR